MQFHVVEGNSQMLDGGAMFGNAPKPLWSQWIKPDHLNRIPMACRCLLLVTDNGENILFETGIGTFFEPKLKERFGVVENNHCLLDNLQSIGLAHTDIDYIVLSHLHFDHAGGLLTSWEEGAEQQLLFPNAKYVTGEKQWQHAQTPHSRDRASFLPKLNDLLMSSGRLVLVNDSNQSDILEKVTFSFSDGHTPGLMLSEIASDNGPLVFSSDLIPGEHWVHLPICMGYDRFPEKLIDEKKQLLEGLIQRDGRLFFTHDINIACGLVKQDSKQRYFVEEVTL